MNKFIHFPASSVLLAILLISCTGTKNTSQVPGTGASERDGSTSSSSFEDAIKNTRAIEGLFTIYQDTADGSTKMAISYDQIGSEFIYFGQTVDGPIMAGQFRGFFRDNRVFTIQRYFDRIEFIIENTGYFFDEDSPLSRAADANISRSIMVSEKIVADDTAKKMILINSDTIFLSESLTQVKPTPNPNMRPGQAFTLGNLSREKTKFLDIRSYPENTEIFVEYVYDNPTPMHRGGPAVTDARSVPVHIQHSFIAMPDNDFVPRRDDPRVGYFGEQINDQTGAGPTPFRDVINRWHLVKTDPEAAISEPVEPIVWWIENTTPYEFRDAIAEGILAWNHAFEAAGFKNVMQVKIQPDDADWDARDIRYNVIRWTSSPIAAFGGYGPHFNNPKTGQILGANIMLEWMFFTRNIRVEDVLTSSFELPENLMDAMDHRFCSFGNFMHENHMFGVNALEVMGFDESRINEFHHESLVMLTLHELGHTLGLNHNMQASNLHSPEDIHNTAITDEIGLTGSVMDYSVVNIARDPENQGRFFDVIPGPYDVWAIQYGYSTAATPEDEQKILTSILNRSAEPALAFGNDADDMRSPGKAIDPRVMVGDLTSDPVAYGVERVLLVKDLMDGLIDKYRKDGQSHQELLNAYGVLMGQYNSQMNVISRYIGGVYRDRAFVGQEGADLPFRPVENERQKDAMARLSQFLFSPDAFSSSSEVYNYLQGQRRFFSVMSGTEDPKIHDQVLGMQRGVLAHLLHPVTMKRMTDSRLYGNEYPAAEVVNDLTSAIFREDARGNVNTFRQNLQIEYVNRLIAITGADPYDHMAKSAVLYNIQQIRSMMNNKGNINAETRAHTEHIKLLIDKALKTS